MQAIAEGCGVFVEPGAPVGGDGTQDNPFNSLADAIAQAEMQVPTRNVYVCATAEPLDEAVVLDGEEYLLGGVTCGDWKASGTKTEWTVSGGGAPLRFSGATAAHVQGFRIVAENATGFDAATLQGNSSIAVIADGSIATLKSVEVLAGTGASGGMGMSQAGQAPGRQSLPNDFNGNPGGGCAMPAGADKIYVCPGGAQTSGGAGGSGGLNSGAPGFDGAPDITGTTGEGGFGEPSVGAFDCVGNFGNGTGGLGGMAGSLGSGGLAATASLSALGYTGNPGGAGGNGQPGEGGGGGGGRKGNGANGCVAAGPSGGGGGAGGCGGLGGGGGGAGGASIALMSLNSMLTLTDVLLTSAAAGPGGAGGDWQLGGQGGNGANGGGVVQACSGGNGGAGGNGGPGGGGAGGPSLGIAWTGTEPVIDPANITIAGAAAAGGAGGTGGNMGESGLLAKVQGY
jgi:hypothetical protein